MVEGLEKFAVEASIMAMNLLAVACLPLRGIPADSDQPEILGILYLDSTRAMHSLSGLDERILTKLALEAGNVLERVETLKTIEKRKLLERDLALAEETQKSLLPRDIPQLDYLRLHAFSKPTRYVGGDFYHFSVSKDGSFTGLLADVSGKGVSASLLSSMFLGCIDMLLNSGQSPAAVLNQLNRFFCRKSTDRFVTIFLFSTGADGSGDYISAGHNTAYLYRAATKEIEELPSTGLLLGVFGFASYEPSPFHLNVGDILLVYSDGLTEAENSSGEQFGEERLQELILREAPSGTDHMETALLASIQDFTAGHAQTDDITIMIAERI
jgi:sigma-B regulation protein RsbU (phosphoserine phosphatase)